MQSEKKSFKKVLGVIGNILLWAFLIFSMLITLMVFSAQNSPDGIPSVFGKSLLTVSTNSMHPVFDAGDLIIMEKIPEYLVQDLEVGDIITYRSPIDLDGDGRTGDINTHRIYAVDAEKEEFVTKGDNNPVPDNEGDNAHTVSYHAVVGTYNGTRLPGVGKFIAFLRTSMGFFICIVLPLILFFLYELYVFISVVVSERMRKKAEAEPKIDEEEIKRKAIEEFLKKQAEAKAAEEKKAEEPAKEEASDEKAEEPAKEEIPDEKAEEPAKEEAAEEKSEETEKEEQPAEEKAEEKPEAEEKSADDKDTEKSEQ